MEAYNKLLEQFHHQETSFVQTDIHIKYKDLLNEIKLSKEKKYIFKKEKSFEHSRLKQFNQSTIKQNLVEKSFKFIKETYQNDQNNQKFCIYTLQTESLEQEIKQLKKSMNQIKSQKLALQEQLQMLIQKQTQTFRTKIESSQIKKHLQIQIRALKTQNYQNQVKFHEKIQNLKQKLADLKEQNMLYSSRYNILNQGIQKSQQLSFLDTIVGFGKHIKKKNQFKKKIYTKEKIQAILRAFYVISKLSTLNYGNIIEILSKNKDIKSNKLISLQQLKLRHMYLDQNGQQISIGKLIQNINNSLLTQEEIRLLTKFKIVQYYQKLGINFDQKLITLIKNQFTLLTSWFTRIQHRNSQLNEQRRHLQKNQQALNRKIQSIEQKSENSQIFYIQERQQRIDLLSQKLDQNSKILFQFNIRSCQLIKKFTSLNKLFDKIVKKTERKTFRKCFLSEQTDQDFLKQFNQLLYRSPQHIIIQWSSAMKKIRSSLYKTTNKSLSAYSDQNSQGRIYLNYVMKNDLLRVYANPQMYNAKISDLQNLQNTCNKVFQFQDKVLTEIKRIMRNLLIFSKNGIDQFQKYNSKKNQAIQIFCGFFQKDDKLSKFLIKDQIKEKFCVQSPEYFRRDNFRLLQKCQRIQLKKKGLYVYHSFVPNTTQELANENRPQTSMNQSINNTLGFRSARGSYRKLQSKLSDKSIKHNYLSTSRQKQNIRKKDLRDLLSNISNIASQNHKYRIRKKTQTGTSTPFQQRSFTKTQI